MPKNLAENEISALRGNFFVLMVFFKGVLPKIRADKHEKHSFPC